MSRSKSQTGFTIIELMIATTVFSVMLVMVTVVISGITRLYYKGINQARVQDNVRVISNEVAEHIRLGNGFIKVGPYPSPTSVTPTVVEYAYCLGDQRYTYVINRQMGVDTSSARTQVRHVLWRDTVANGACLTDPDGAGPLPPSTLPNLMDARPSPGGVEMIAPGSRLAAFDINESGTYSINMTVSYGENDLLTNSGTQCIEGAGTQFCAVAGLLTNIAKRM